MPQWGASGGRNSLGKLHVVLDHCLVVFLCVLIMDALELLLASLVILIFINSEVLLLLDFL